MNTRPVARNRRQLRREAAQAKTRRRARSGRSHRRGSRAWMLRVSLVAVIALSAVGLLGTGGTIGIVDYFAGDLPSIDQLQSSKLLQTTRIVDRNGNLIAAVYHQNRTVVPLSKVSKNLQAATIDTEDRTFYSNSGVDYRRLVIAIVYDLTHRSSTLGGSTITEQVVKNDVLDTAEAQSRTVSRKFRELVLAEEMERRYTKQQILELYLNTINYGNSAWGAEAAAETYFGVHASDLSWAEATFLAGLPQAPALYDPFGTPDQLQAVKERWRQVLDGVVTVGDLSASQADSLYRSDLIEKMIAAHKAAPPSPNPLTAHFVDYVKQYALQRYGPTALYEGGLTITTTLDLGTQALADKWVKAGVQRYRSRAVNTGAMLVMNPSDGEILAMVGSADYNNDAIRGQVNLTGIDPLGWRGVGSSFKVYTYGAALEAGLVNPATLLNDANSSIAGHTFSDWDAKHEGWIPLRTALAQSRNLPALWTYSAEGGARVADFMRRLGVTASLENIDGIATTLGHDPLSMAEHLAAYSAFDNGGYRVSPHSVLKVTDPSGRALESFDPNAEHVQVISPDLAYLMTDLLRGPVKTYLGALGSRPVAGKSGTTEAYTGSIYVGYTPNLAVAASLMHIDAGPKCLSGYARYATNFPPSGWQCPTAVLFGEDVGVGVWKPFLDAYYSSHPWPAAWKAPFGVVTDQVCKYDGGLVATGGYNEIFLKGFGEPTYQCGKNPYPGETPYVAPVPSPSPSPNPSPSPPH
ncbi:MAG TPA: transglycosylase domain-containing protein [Candidatus Dormibacteraeota bacterium]|nr:transglycosylase domain-containing protein [Candidatus Dormibacteraeota bacterium]